MEYLQIAFLNCTLTNIEKYISFLYKLITILFCVMAKSNFFRHRTRPMIARKGIIQGTQGNFGVVGYLQPHKY